MLVIVLGVAACLGSAWLIGSGWISRGVLAAAFLSALGVYAVKGDPDMPGAPLDDRIDALRQSDPMQMTNAQRLVLLQQYAVERPDEPQPHKFIGDILLSQGRTGEAIRAYQSALRRDQSHVPSLAGLGRALLAQGSHDQAQNAFRAALAGDERYTPALSGLAETQVALAGGRVDDEAARLFAMVLSIDPEDVQAAFMIGMQGWLAGDREGALNWWTSAMDRMPAESPSRRELASLVEQIQSAMSAVAQDSEATEDTSAQED